MRAIFALFVQILPLESSGKFGCSNHPPMLSDKIIDGCAQKEEQKKCTDAEQKKLDHKYYLGGPKEQPANNPAIGSLARWSKKCRLT